MATLINNQACSGLFQLSLSLHHNQQVPDALSLLAGKVGMTKDSKSSWIIIIFVLYY